MSDILYPEAIREAWLFAGIAHQLQVYTADFGQISYLAHLGIVASYARTAAATDGTGDPQLSEIIGILHDSVEDCGVNPSTIEERFGQHVAVCVKALSKKPGLRGRAASEEAVSRIVQAPKEAAIVKLADRLCNIGGNPNPRWTAWKIADYTEESKHILHVLHAASPFLAQKLQERITVWEGFA
ncbi:MAG: HD domain-containing protein [Desulfovibrio sp.]|nr:HD domain-containing protein [Desulfovibrio sp.]